MADGLSCTECRFGSQQIHTHMLEVEMRVAQIRNSIRSLSPFGTPGRKVTACALGLMLLTLGDVAIYKFRFHGKNKVDANSVVSPWDISGAPPAFIHRSEVKVVKPPKVIITPRDKAKSTKYTGKGKYGTRTRYGKYTRR